jgi:hypothetical protein
MNRFVKNFPLTHWLQSLAFSGMTDNHLTRLNITAGSILILKPNFTERLQNTTTIGRNEIWSSDNLYGHLRFLKKLVSRVVC